MRDALPRQFFARDRFAEATTVRMQPGGLVASIRRRGGETAIGPVLPGSVAMRRLRNRRPAPVVLILPPSALLQQPASMPLAAERELASVLRYEMDRLTPFRADAVFWTWHIDRRDREAGRLLLRLLLVPKVALGSSLAALEAAGLRPAVLEVPVPGGVERLPAWCSRAPPGQHARLPSPAGCAPPWRSPSAPFPCCGRSGQSGGRKNAVADLRPKVALVDALRRRITEHASGNNLFAAELVRIGSPLRALATVTATLPDDTYLTSFAMREGKISMAGRSAAAASLIGLLAADPDLRDPAFGRSRHAGGGRGRPVLHPGEPGAMMALPTGRRGQLLAMAVTLLAALLIWFGCIAPALGWYAARRDYLEQQQALAARMRAVASTAPALQRILDNAASAAPAPTAVLEGASDAIAGATLQQAVQDMAAKAGASISSAELLPAEPVGSFRRISLHVSVNGPWTVLMALLGAIAQATPRMLVDDLSLRESLALGQADVHPLAAGFTVIAFAGPAASR